MLTVYPDYERLSAAAAEAIRGAGREALAKRGRFDLALSGGRTPRRAYELLAGALRADPGLRDALHVYWADERCVPPDDPRSNYRLAKEALLDPAGIATGNVERIRGEAPDSDAEAARYESVSPAACDLVVLGMGADGHTASLFPHGELLTETRLRFAAAVAPVEPSHRITITPVGLALTRRALVIVSGADKSDALARVLAGRGSIARTPARLVRDAMWLVDAAAQSGIS